MSQTDGRLCPKCHSSLEHMERTHWMMNLCRECGFLWLEGDNLAYTIQHLHLSPGDSGLEFSKLGTIVQRNKNSGTDLAKK